MSPSSCSASGTKSMRPDAESTAPWPRAPRLVQPPEQQTGAPQPNNAGPTVPATLPLAELPLEELLAFRSRFSAAVASPGYARPGLEYARAFGLPDDAPRPEHRNLAEGQPRQEIGDAMAGEAQGRDLAGLDLEGGRRLHHHHRPRERRPRRRRRSAPHGLRDRLVTRGARHDKLAS